MLASQSVLTDKNLYAYCDNNPVMRTDSEGTAWETIFDVLSLSASIMEVAFNPADPFAWMGLAGDAVDLIPFVTGVGETIRALKTVSKVAEGTDEAIDTYNALRRINKGSGLEVHHIVEKRFAKEIGYAKTGGKMPSIALTKDVHRKFTNKWREIIGYGVPFDRKTLMEAAIRIYADDPELLGAAIYTIVHEYKP